MHTMPIIWNKDQMYTSAISFLFWLQICDVVVVSRLLNATLVIPVLQPTTGNKGVRSPFFTSLHILSLIWYSLIGCTNLVNFQNYMLSYSSDFKSFTYLYNEDQFIVALEKDISVVKALPKNIKAAKRRKEIPSFKVPYSASPDYYIEVVLPALKQYVVVELKVADGGCLQVSWVCGSFNFFPHPLKFCLKRISYVIFFLSG